MDAMEEIRFDLPSEEATRVLGASLGAILEPGDILLLSGPLGAGKTTLARALIAQRCGVAEAPSPTFSLVETYPGDGVTIWHFDFYRLKRDEDAWELGIEEAFSEGASIIEWPERALSVIPPSAMSISLSIENGRRSALAKAPDGWGPRLQVVAERVKNQSKDAT